MTRTAERQLEQISALLKEAGYDSYAQITGYYKTGNESYITRKGNARQMIRSISMDEIGEYLKKYR